MALVSRVRDDAACVFFWHEANVHSDAEHVCFEG